MPEGDGVRNPGQPSGRRKILALSNQVQLPTVTQRLHNTFDFTMNKTSSCTLVCGDAHKAVAECTDSRPKSHYGRVHPQRVQQAM